MCIYFYFQYISNVLFVMYRVIGERLDKTDNDYTKKLTEFFDRNSSFVFAIN